MRTQYLSYHYIINMPLSPIERSLLQVIHVRPEYCLENLSELGRLIQRSVRTVQRAITTLAQKGIIQKKYTLFKRIKLVLVSLQEQEKISKSGPVAQALRFCNFLKYKKKKDAAVYDTTPVSGIYTTSVSGPISSSNKIKSIINNDLKLMSKQPKNLEAEKKRQLLAMAELMKSL